jgi:hypothetical protein
MTFIWLVVWLVAGTPAVVSWGPWNDWGTALFVCLAIDVTGSLGTHGARSDRREVHDDRSSSTQARP